MHGRARRDRFDRPLLEHAELARLRWSRSPQTQVDVPWSRANPHFRFTLARRDASFFVEMTRSYLLAIDQGTTGSTALVLDESARVLARATREFPQHFPKPAWVEHEPDEI